MSSTPEEPTTTASGEDGAELRDLARDRVENMPAETALGHADPAGGVDTDPRDFEGDDNA